MTVVAENTEILGYRKQKKSEKATFGRTAKAIQNFMDPCQIELDDKLYFISSGAAVPFT